MTTMTRVMTTTPPRRRRRKRQRRTALPLPVLPKKRSLNLEVWHETGKQFSKGINRLIKTTRPEYYVIKTIS